MIFTETKLKGVYLIEPERRDDERGFFARIWCQREFEAHGLAERLEQCSISFSKRKGTLRGLHFQVFPNEETKVVRCTMGAAFDVVVDLRPGSPTHRRWVGIELTAENRWMVYIPGGCAHGFQTLADSTELFYQMSVFYEPGSARGVRWNDPAIAVVWPLPVSAISPRDAAFNLLNVNTPLCPGGSCQ
jgi:dTDP-4-dehydrorhamnose 3,5-epimerase